MYHAMTTYEMFLPTQLQVQRKATTDACVFQTFCATQRFDSFQQDNVHSFAAAALSVDKERGGSESSYLVEYSL